MKVILSEERIVTVRVPSFWVKTKNDKRVANEMAGFRDDVECFSLNTSK